MKTYRYPGINPFTTDEKDIFFGRTSEIDKLFKLLRVEELVVLFSKSGLGKSSLINAGVIPMIQEKNVFLPISVKFSGYQEEGAFGLS